MIGTRMPPGLTPSNPAANPARLPASKPFRTVVGSNSAFLLGRLKRFFLTDVEKHRLVAVSMGRRPRLQQVYGWQLPYIESIFLRPYHPWNPQRTPQPSRSRRRTRQRPPSQINGVRQIRIDKSIAVTIIRARSFHPHHLMPAVHSGDRIGMHRESNILMHPRTPPQQPLLSGSC